MATAILIGLIVAPALLAYLLKSSAALGFLSLTGGFAVMTLSGGEIEQFVGKTRVTSLTSNDVALGLLVLPLLLTLLFSYRSVNEKNRRLLQLLPGLSAGALLALAAAPMINAKLQTDISSSQLWSALQNAQAYIVSGGLLLSLLLIWAGGHKKAESKKHKKS